MPPSLSQTPGQAVPGTATATPVPAPAPAGAPSAPAPYGVLAVGADAGSAPRVKVYDAATRQLKRNFLAEQATFRGGIRVAAGDMTGDGQADVVTAAGEGGGNVVRVWDGRTGALRRTFTAFSAAESDGVFVATGDVDGDGRHEVIAGTDAGGAGLLRVFGAGGALGTLEFGAEGAGGVRVAAGDVNGDGKDDLVAAAGPGQLPRVWVFDGGTGAEVYGFFAGDATDRSGLNVAAGDVTGDGLADVITGAAAGAAEVRVFRGADTAGVSRFVAEPAGFAGGVRVATADADGDGRLDVVTATGPGAGRVRAFDATGRERHAPVSPFGAGHGGGLFVAAAAPGQGGGVGLLSDPPVVTLEVLIDTTAEGSPDPAVYRLHRTGDTTDGLFVYVTSTGEGEAYDTGSGVVTFIEPGDSYVDVQVVAIDDDLQEGEETVVRSVFAAPGVAYTVGSPSVGVITILDDDGPSPVVPVPLCPRVGPVWLGGGTGGPTGTSNGVRPSSGVPAVTLRGPSSGGLGGWGAELTFGGELGRNAPAQYGSGFAPAWMPWLKVDSAGTVVVTAAGDALYFDPSGGGFQARHSGKEVLTYDSGAGRYTLLDAAGGRTAFYDFDSGLAAAKRGTLDAHTDAAGNETEVTAWDSGGAPEEVRRSSTVGSTTVTESYLSAFYPSGANAGKVSSVTLRRKVDSGSWATARSVEYSYYDGTEANGPLGSLKLSVEKDAAGNAVDRQYFRWYTSGQADGHAGALKYLFGGAAYGRLAAAFTDPAAASDAQVAAYADVYLEYDGGRRVKEQTVQGEGCSICTGGQGTYAFARAFSPFADGYNTWRTKQTTTNPDGSTRSVYANFAGEVMLDVTKVGSAEWATFYKYDSSGRLVLTADPSAVSGYDESRPDLLNNQSGNYQYLRDAEGLVETTTYGSSTTATSSAAGDVDGYVKQTGLRRGETGTSVPQSLTQYVSRTDGTDTVYVAASETRYRNDDGTGAQETTTAYAWRSGTLQAESVTVTLPAVTAGQNGSGSATSSASVMDAYGRVVWSKDAAGYISHAQSDQKTGGVVKSIADVD
ncbi:MAG: FG-GAP repeat domain-containing protein, partial [Gemmataceae bacterium]